MKSKLFFLFFSMCTFSVANTQNLVDNLKSYKSINYYLIQDEEVNSLFSTSFTKGTVEDRLSNFFTQNNISATEISTANKFPVLQIEVDKPNTADGQCSSSYGNAISFIATNFEITFNVLDIVGGKTVIVYAGVYRINCMNCTDDYKTNALWKVLNGGLDEFNSSWKSTH